MKKLLNLIKKLSKKQKSIQIQEKVYIDCKDLFLVSVPTKQAVKTQL